MFSSKSRLAGFWLCPCDTTTAILFAMMFLLTGLLLFNREPETCALRKAHPSPLRLNEPTSVQLAFNRPLGYFPDSVQMFDVLLRCE
jgi:hypothetical protein